MEKSTDNSLFADVGKASEKFREFLWAHEKSFNEIKLDKEAKKPDRKGCP
jgi:hypothetical protein